MQKPKVIHFETPTSFVFLFFILTIWGIQQAHAQTPQSKEKTQIRPPEMNISLNYSINYRAKNAMKIYLNYEIENHILKMGPLQVNPADFKIDLSERILMIFWPKQVMQSPELQIKTKQGKIIFSAPTVNRLILGDNLKKLNQQIVQFCFIDSQALNRLHQFCTGYYKFDHEKLKQNRKLKPLVVHINNSKAENTLRKEVQIDESISLHVLFSDGATYQWTDSARSLWLYDIHQLNSLYVVQGVESMPLEPSELLQREKETPFTQMIGFEKTIKDDRQFWKSQISEEAPYLHIRQANGGVFQYELNLNLIPSNTNRIYLADDTPRVTYSDKAFFKGYKPKNLKLTPIKGRIKEAKNDPIFIWEAATLYKHNLNRAELEIIDGEQKYLGFYEVFRGVPTEFSYRVSGIIDSKGLVFTSEFALNHWFEKIFDSQNTTWSKLRWGLSLKQFQTLTPIKVAVGDDSVDPMNLSAFNIDVKYRLTPGIWDRDETHGFMISYQNTTFGPTHAPIAGLGWFWGRSMPRVFDELMNKLPFMGHDKWVDMEFIFFPYSLSKDVSLTANYNLNFHGKVLWTESIFGEAGFGLKKYGLEDRLNNKLQDLYTIYGTVGLGINF